MAVTPSNVSSEIVMVFEDGTYASGAPKYKNRYIKSLKTDADDEAVYSVAASLATLQTKTLSAVQRRDLILLEYSE